MSSSSSDVISVAPRREARMLPLGEKVENPGCPPNASRCVLVVSAILVMALVLITGTVCCAIVCGCCVACEETDAELEERDGRVRWMAGGWQTPANALTNARGMDALVGPRLSR